MLRRARPRTVPTIVPVVALVTSLLAACAHSGLRGRGPAPIPLPAGATFDRDAEALFAARHAWGAFVLHHPRTDRTFVVAPERAVRRYTPASTFKIPNALIGLATGALPDERFTMKWDGTQHTFVKAWNRDHDLRSAMAHSVVWYFQAVARRIGPERMRAAIDAIGYGNRDLSGGIDRFWLDGGLRISPWEQVRFLERLWSDALPFPRETQAKVRALLVEYDRGPGYVVRGKTGTAIRTTQVAWWVGAVERADGPWFFALLMRLRPEDHKRLIGPLRFELAKALLQRFGAVPRQP